MIVTSHAAKIKRFVFKDETSVMPRIFNRDRYTALFTEECLEISLLCELCAFVRNEHH